MEGEWPLVIVARDPELQQVHLRSLRQPAHAAHSHAHPHPTPRWRRKRERSQVQPGAHRQVGKVHQQVRPLARGEVHVRYIHRRRQEAGVSADQLQEPSVRACYAEDPRIRPVQNAQAVGFFATDIPYGANQISRFGVEETVVARLGAEAHEIGRASCRERV